MSKNLTTTTTNFTPPIRSIATEASSTISSDEISSSKRKVKSKRRERSPSTASSTSSSSSSSPSTSQSDHEDIDDDFSSIDETNPEWIRIRARLQAIRRLMPRDSLSSLDEPQVITYPTAECQVCLENFPIRPLSCCSSTVCSSCLHAHLSSHINQAQIRISCPSCPHIFTREEILLTLTEKDETGEIAERYKRFYADINHEAHIKTCPQCCALKEIDRKLVEGSRWRKTIPRHVVCDHCQFSWCFYCHAPWHGKMTCKEYREGEKMLRAWAAQTDENQQNAQQCPRCKVFISRNGGCPHMVCSKCHCDFCYNCGKRRYGIKFLGSHESRFSPFGCKYNLYPNKPILRRTVRGLVAGAVTVAAPVAAVGAAAILAVGATIGAPTYGTYRLVKYIRHKRRGRHTRTQSLSTNVNGNETDDDFDDNIRRAVEASLETAMEESARWDLENIAVDFVDADRL